MARTEQIASLFASVGFKIDQRSITSLNKSLSSIETRVNKIKQYMSAVGSSNKNYGTAFKGMERQALGAATGIDSVTKKLNAGLAPLKAYTQSAQTLAYTFGVIRSQSPIKLPRIPSTGSGGRSGGRSSGGGMGGSGFLHGAVGGMFGGGLPALMRGFMPGLGAAYAVMNTVRSGRESLSAENALSAITGSREKGAQEMNYLRNFSQKYGMDFKGSAKGYTTIAASAQGSKMQGAGAKKIFEGASLYGASLGRSDDQMNRAFTALGQMLSKGKIMSEELKGQLAEALPGAVQKFAESMNVTVPVMYEMMQAGKVSSDELERFGDLLLEAAKSGGALKTYMESSLASQRRFQTSWSIFTEKLLKGGLDKGLAKTFDALSKILTGLTPVLLVVAGAFSTLMGVVAPLAEMFLNIMKFVAYMIDEFPVWTGFITAGLVALFAMPTAIKAIGFAFNALMKTPALIAFMAAILAIEDLVVWASGAPAEATVIGHHIGQRGDKKDGGSLGRNGFYDPKRSFIENLFIPPEWDGPSKPKIYPIRPAIPGHYLLPGDPYKQLMEDKFGKEPLTEMLNSNQQTSNNTYNIKVINADGFSAQQLAREIAMVTNTTTGPIPA